MLIGCFAMARPRTRQTIDELSSLAMSSDDIADLVVQIVPVDSVASWVFSMPFCQLVCELAVHKHQEHAKRILWISSSKLSNLIKPNLDVVMSAINAQYSVLITQCPLPSTLST